MNQISPVDAVTSGAELTPSEASTIEHAWMKSSAVAQSESPLNADELTSLSALIAYVAFQSGAPEFRVERALADHFNIPNAKLLSTNQFDKAVHYLVDSIPE